jgi:BirA family transcriptional regulator, biotin operon repressor / biotin---[acetyl-CoA-carboxylase] ligase
LKSNRPDDLRDTHAIPSDIGAAVARELSHSTLFGHRMHWLRETTSTNDVAAHLAELGAPEGTIVAADAQTAGRGRLGRAWFSPPGAGLYVSILLRPAREAAKDFDPAALLTLACGVAAAEGIRAATGLPAEIKWPNDVMVGRRKLAGILAEAAAEAGTLKYVILGFGVNLQPAAYPADIAKRATSVEAETGRPADRARIFVEILKSLEARHRDLQAGKFDVILSAWRSLAPSLPSSIVEWDSPGGPRRGRAEDIDERGALLVRVGGTIERLIAGEVRWI